MDDTDKWLAQYEGKVNGLKQAAADLERDLAASTVTVTSSDESVTVTIGSNGSLRNVVFGQRVTEHSPAALSALLMKTVARGQRAVAEKVVEAFAPVGEGTSAMALLASFVPPQDAGLEPDDQPPPAPNKYDELASGAPDDVPPRPPVPPRPVPAAAPLPVPPLPVPPLHVAPPPAPQPVRAVAARPRRAAEGIDDGDDFDEGRPW